MLILLTATIGLPYFLLSSTSPLLQAWLVRRTGSAVPYRLFALSNFGSMLALLSCPFLVEPHLGIAPTGFHGGAAAMWCLRCWARMAAWVSRGAGEMDSSCRGEGYGR